MRMGGKIGFRAGMRPVLCFCACALLSSAAAEAGSESRFEDNGDGTVSDSRTELMWQQQDDGLQRSWKEAVQYCDDLQLAGYDDWWLPAVKELRSIVGTETKSPNIDGRYFRKATGDYYWSSTIGTDGRKGAWGVDFRFGRYDDTSKVFSGYVRCVRS